MDLNEKIERIKKIISINKIRIKEISDIRNSGGVLTEAQLDNEQIAKRENELFEKVVSATGSDKEKEAIIDYCERELKKEAKNSASTNFFHKIRARFGKYREGKLFGNKSPYRDAKTRKQNGAFYGALALIAPIAAISFFGLGAPIFATLTIGSGVALGAFSATKSYRFFANKRPTHVTQTYKVPGNSTERENEISEIQNYTKENTIGLAAVRNRLLRHTGFGTDVSDQIRIINNNLATIDLRAASLNDLITNEPAITTAVQEIRQAKERIKSLLGIQDDQLDLFLPNLNLINAKIAVGELVHAIVCRNNNMQIDSNLISRISRSNGYNFDDLNSKLSQSEQISQALLNEFKNNQTSIVNDYNAANNALNAIETKLSLVNSTQTILDQNALEELRRTINSVPTHNIGLVANQEKMDEINAKRALADYIYLKEHINDNPPIVNQAFIDQVRMELTELSAHNSGYNPSFRVNATVLTAIITSFTSLISGPQQTGPQQTGPQQTGPQQTGPQQTGPQQTGPQQTGSQQTGPQQTGPQQTGPQQTGPQQTGPQQTGPQQTGPQQTGPQQTGPQQTGPQTTPLRRGRVQKYQNLRVFVANFRITMEAIKNNTITGNAAILECRDYIATIYSKKAMDEFRIMGTSDTTLLEADNLETEANEWLDSQRRSRH